MALSVKRVRALKKPGRYFDRDGLYLVVKTPTNASWQFRYERRGIERWHGGGSAALFDLAVAREWAREAKRQLKRGFDPIDARREARAKQAAEAARSKTFAKVAADYYDAHEASWSAKHCSDFTGSLRDHVHPTLGHLPVPTIDEALVLAVLTPIWHGKTATAKRVRARIESVLDFANAAGYRSGDNPARWKGNLQHLLARPSRIASVTHQPSLPYAEMPAFVRELRAVEGVAARALEFLILTAVRTDEARLARWSEIDLAQRVWTIPASRMKSRKEHRVPLSDRALALLRGLPREGDFVFVGAKAGAAIGTNAMLVTLKALRPEATVHGFRSTFRDWAEERTSFNSIVAEMALAHTVGDAVKNAYRRSVLLAKRAKLMQAWSDHCGAPVGVSDAVPLRARSN